MSIDMLATMYLSNTIRLGSDMYTKFFHNAFIL